MTKASKGQSQVMDLFMHVAELLNAKSDREIAQIADGSVDNVANWRSGTVREFKPQTLRAIKENLEARLHAMRDQLRLVQHENELGLVAVEIDESSGPSALQRQFFDRVTYDYLGHRFLYFDPQGALAWENLIRAGYEQDCWIKGVTECMRRWLDTSYDDKGRCRGPIAHACSFERGTPKGLDVVSLGPGEGSKEVVILQELCDAERRHGSDFAWLTLVLVDVSIPLLLRAAKSSRQVLAADPSAHALFTRHVLAFCADFEEGELFFMRRLPTEVQREQGRRLIPILGNVFGNLRDEESFVRQRLWPMTRPGDFVWIEVALRLDSYEADPLYRMTLPHRAETASEANRRILLEGPYRRWEASLGRQPSTLETRIWIRENDDASAIPGSFNFCHDLVIQEERRVCTMLYSRRYQLEGLTRWFSGLDFDTIDTVPVADSTDKSRLVHLLLQRR